MWEITCGEWMTWGCGGGGGGGIFTTCDPKPRGRDFLPHYLPRMLICNNTRLSLGTWPYYGGVYFFVARVKWRVHFVCTQPYLGRGWPCWHVLEGPTDLKGEVLKVWTWGEGWGPTDKREHRHTPNLLFDCEFSPFLQTLLCLVWSHSPSPQYLVVVGYFISGCVRLINYSLPRFFSFFFFFFWF